MGKRTNVCGRGKLCCTAKDAVNLRGRQLATSIMEYLLPGSKLLKRDLFAFRLHFERAGAFVLDRLNRIVGFRDWHSTGSGLHAIARKPIQSNVVQ